jgi:hypothetical protein
MTFQKDIQFKIVPPACADDSSDSKETPEQQLANLKVAWRKALIENEKWSNGTIKKLQVEGDPNPRYFYCLRVDQSGCPESQLQSIVAIDEDLQPTSVTVLFTVTPQGVIMKVTSERIPDPRAHRIDPDKVARTVQNVIAGRI